VNLQIMGGPTYVMLAQVCSLGSQGSGCRIDMWTRGMGDSTCLVSRSRLRTKVDFVYDANDRLAARTSDGRTKLFFYFADTGRVAEETGAGGATKALYLSDSAGRPIAEVKDGNWSWLLRDAEGSVATRVSDSGNVKSHSAYDPYGASNDAGSGIAGGERDPETELGYQSESADALTGNILVARASMTRRLSASLRPTCSSTREATSNLRSIR
jgi:hypothetical protein